MTQLPPGWATALLGEVAATSLGKMLDSKRNTGANPVPYLRNINVRWGAFDLRELLTMDIRPDELDRVLARRGDVIACEGGEPGRAAVWPHDDPVAIQKALHLIRPHAGVDPDFLSLLLRHQATSGQLDRLFTGTTIKHLPQEKLRLVEVPVPPSAEQERIVTAIEEAFSLLEAGEAGLHATRTRLKRMRDSVLAAAITGQLVPQDPTDRPAATLLVDLGIATSSGPTSLPPGWATALLGEVTRLVPGSTPKGLDSHTDPAGEVPFLKVGDLASAERVLVDSRTRLSKEVAIELRVRTCPAGTLVFPKNGGAIATNRKRILGVPAAFDLNTMGLVPKGSLGSWMWIWLLQLDLRPLSDGSIVPQINRSDMEPIQVPIPPAAEQARIVAEVERQFSFIEAAERAVSVALVRSAGLRRSVLKAAFEGQLVPQDPSDEPATVLLERIAAERAAAPTKASRRGRAKVEAS